jgi:hypothetical protein
MPTYKITAPDGNSYNVTAPDGTSQDQVLAYAKSNYKGASSPKQSLLGKTWDALGKPEQMSKQGLGQLAQMVPEGKVTGNMAADLARGTPRILANTLAKAAPGFVSRGSLLTAGVMPVAKGIGAAAEAVGPGIAGQLESLSGMKPGLLGKAFKDPSLIFSKIPKGAREAYQESGDFFRKTSPEISQIPRPMQLVQKLLSKAKSGIIGQDEALAGRKAVDQLWESKTITEDFKNMARQTFDAIAKTSPDIKEADTAFSRGKQAAGLRQLFPQNKFGGTSAFKTAIMAGLNAMGPAGKVGMAAMSPLAMGSGATALGAASKPLNSLANNPQLAVALQQLISALTSQRQQQPQGSGIQ